MNGLVVELGAGTGTVTQELLRTGISPHNLLIIEKAPTMIQVLHQRFPQLNIIQGDASDLCQLLPQERRADYIISSLPLISLGKTVREAIILAMHDALRSSTVFWHCSCPILAMHDALREGGILVQYTYSWGSSNPSLMDKFQLIDSRRIWDNVPPAQVFRFMRKPAAN